jgi:LPXTG-motif cell wall-anchored protein
MKKSSARRPAAIAAAVVLSAALIGGSSAPAFAASWTGESVEIDNITFEMNTDTWGMAHVYGWSAPNSLGDTFTHESGTLEFVNDGDTSTEGPVCDTALVAATQTVDAAGNITIACEAVEIENYPGIWVTPEFYFYAEGDLVRVFYTIENRTAADVTVDEIRLVDDWDDDTDYAKYTTNVGDLVTDDVLTADTSTRWQVGGYTDDGYVLLSEQAIFGSAWSLAGMTAFASTTADMQQFMTHSSLDYVIPAGAKVYVASYATYTYVGSLELLSNTNPDAADGFADMVAFMSVFDSFSGRLTQGLPECIEVANWGSTCAAPALPDTGLDASIAWSIAAGGALLLVAGAALIVLRRRAAH